MQGLVEWAFSTPAAQHRDTTSLCDGQMLHLQGLEERFLALIEPKMAAALSQKNGQRVQQLSGMLLGMESTGTVEKLYNTARMAPLQVAVSLHWVCIQAKKTAPWVCFYSCTCSQRRSCLDCQERVLKVSDVSFHSKMAMW